MVPSTTLHCRVHCSASNYCVQNTTMDFSKRLYCAFERPIGAPFPSQIFRYRIAQPLPPPHARLETDRAPHGPSGQLSPARGLPFSSFCGRTTAGTPSTRAA